MSTDELGESSPSVSAPAWLSDVKGTVGELSNAALTGIQRVKSAAEREFGVGSNRSQERAESEEVTPSDDLLADDDAALEAKFRTLEKKYRVE